MKLKYIWYGYYNNSDLGLENNFNKLRAPNCNTYVQLTMSNMYVTWRMLWNLNTYDMGIAI
jgi:hypothetical protein